MPKPTTLNIFAANTNNASDREQGLAAESVGSRLRRERQAQHISEKDAARALRLMLSDLRAIEADDFNISPHDTSLRNYLREYASFLALNADSILAIYDRQAGTNMHRRVQRIANIPGVNPSSSGRLLTGSLVMATVVLGLLVIVKFSDEKTVNQRLAGNDPLAPAPARQTVLSQSITPGTTVVKAADDRFTVGTAVVDDTDGRLTLTDVVENDTATSPPLVAQSADSKPRSQAQNRAMKVAEPRHIANTQSDKPSNRTGTETQLAAQPPAQSHHTDPASSSALKIIEVPARFRNESTAASASLAEDQLKFQFTKDCWVEVYDAQGQRLVAGIEQAGDSLELSGISPFRVLVGYSREVTVQFNGHPVEIEKIDRSFSTLFTVERLPVETHVSDPAPLVTTIRRNTPEPAASPNALSRSK